MSKRTVVTIGREFGSGGREIGKKLAGQMNIAFYDREVLEVAAKESGISKELFELNDEKPVDNVTLSSFTRPVSGIETGPREQEIPLPDDALASAQFAAISKIARMHDCVIVGRCADYVLRREPGCLHIFIHAPLNFRIARVKQIYEISSGEARDMILKTDKRRAAYYNTYSDQKWGEIGNFHLTLDSSVLGLDGSAALIRNMAEMRAE